MSHLETVRVGPSSVVPGGLVSASAELPALTLGLNQLREGRNVRVCSLTPPPQACPESGLHDFTSLPCPQLTFPLASDTCAGWAAPRFDYETIPWGKRERERDPK